MPLGRAAAPGAAVRPRPEARADTRGGAVPETAASGRNGQPPPMPPPSHTASAQVSGPDRSAPDRTPVRNSPKQAKTRRFGEKRTTPADAANPLHGIVPGHRTGRVRARTGPCPELPKASQNPPLRGETDNPRRRRQPAPRHRPRSPDRPGPGAYGPLSGTPQSKPKAAASGRNGQPPPMPPTRSTASSQVTGPAGSGRVTGPVRNSPKQAKNTRAGGGLRSIPPRPPHAGDATPATPAPAATPVTTAAAAPRSNPRIATLLAVPSPGVLRPFTLACNALRRDRGPRPVA
jgi:hypothetical protein